MTQDDWNFSKQRKVLGQAKYAPGCCKYTGLLIIQSNPIMFWGLGSFDPKDSILNIFS